MAAVKRTDKQVTDLVKGFGGANFADILNRLWISGVRTEDLQRALATTSNGTNEPSDIVTRLLNSGVATVDQLKAAPATQVPANPAFQWPFHPENKVNGVVTAVTVNPPNDQLKALGVSTFMGNEGAAPSGGLRGYPDEGPKGQAAKAAVTPPVTTPTPAPNTNPMANVTSTGADTKKEKAPVSEAEVTAYEKEHYTDLTWIKSIPSLNELITKASKEQWSPGKFLGELHSTDWWQHTGDSIRKWTEQQADPETFKKNVQSNANIAKTYASTMGVTLDEETATQMGSDFIKFGWTDQDLHQAILGHGDATNQTGTLGASSTQVKNTAKQFLSTMSDQDAFNWAKQIAGGTATMDNVTQALRSQAKASYPTLAEYIDNGGTPSAYFSQHVSNTAKLLEIDPSTIDLTDPKYNQIISYADPVNGKVRPMTVPESDKFIRSKDEYWKTNNANDQVSSMMETMGTVFGKTGI